MAAIQQLDKGSSAAEVARAFEINPNPLHRWRKEFRHGPGNAFSGPGKRRWEEPRIAQLERKVGQQTLEIDFLKGCLQRIEEQRMLQALTGRPPLVHYIQKQIEEGGAMTALRICALGQITRARLYRLAPEAEHEDPDLDLRDQRIALEFPCYGRPRITATWRTPSCSCEAFRRPSSASSSGTGAANWSATNPSPVLKRQTVELIAKEPSDTVY